MIGVYVWCFYFCLFFFLLFLLFPEKIAFEVFTLFHFSLFKAWLPLTKTNTTKTVRLMLSPWFLTGYSKFCKQNTFSALNTKWELQPSELTTAINNCWHKHWHTFDQPWKLQPTEKVKHIKTIHQQVANKLFECAWPFCGVCT